MFFRRPKHTCPDPTLDALLVSPAMMVDPYPIYRRLREEQPVFWSDTWNAWVVSRFADVAESLKDKENLSNENRQALLFDGLTDDERQSLCPLRHYFAQKDVIGSDPPDHTRMRALVQKAFSPKTVNVVDEPQESNRVGDTKTIRIMGLDLLLARWITATDWRLILVAGGGPPYTEVEIGQDSQLRIGEGGDEPVRHLRPADLSARLCRPCRSR